jgi:pyruvate/2-oxoglutarate/acetoin dehydrogenase E1 component
VNVIAAMAQGLVELLREDPRRVLLGEDVATGGMLGLSKAAVDDEALRPRVISLPLLPATLAAHAGGLACAGLRPIVLLPGPHALLEGLAGLREVAAIGPRTAGERTAPVLFVVPTGPGFGLADDGSDGIDAVLARLGGVRVFTVGRAEDVAAWLADAAAFTDAEEPAVLLVPRMLLASVVEDATAPRGACPATEVVHAGGGATVFTWGDAVSVVLAACESSSAAPTIVEIHRLHPLDADAIVEAARDTGRVAIVHGGGRGPGIASEIAALVAHRALYYLDAPVVRVSGDAAPLLAADEQRALPPVGAVAAAIEELLLP